LETGVRFRDGARRKRTIRRAVWQVRAVILGVPWKHGTMSRVENVEGQVKQLSSDELREFREWFGQFDAEAWDQQFEADVQNRKLDELAARALRDYKAGRATEL
jgi:hypothetical protein